MIGRRSADLIEVAWTEDPGRMVVPRISVCRIDLADAGVSVARAASE
jgi:hypothetical protein